MLIPWPTLVLGFLTSLSLIVAIGAQNAFVLRQGIRREHIGVIILICALSDALLIAAGVAGLGALITQLGWLLLIIQLGGGAFVIAYGVRAVIRATKTETLSVDNSTNTITLGAAVLTILTFTYLNPHVYLDTVLLLGSIASTHGAERWWFGIGAMLGSVAWFCALGFGARWLAPLFRKPLSWRILDGAVALVMFYLGASLLYGFITELPTYWHP